MFVKRNFFEQLDHILDFQINDLKRSLEVAKANFLVSIGCMHTIEFLGGVRNGELGKKGKVESRFKEGVRLLGGEYTEFGEDNMYQLRNSLTHQYLPKVMAINGIFIGSGNTFKQVADKVIRTHNSISVSGPFIMLDMAKLVKDIEKARKRLIDELQHNEQMRLRAEDALLRLPELI